MQSRLSKYCCERVDRIPTLGIQAAVRLSFQRAWRGKLPYSPVLVGALLPLILIAPAAPAQHAGVGAPAPAQQAAGAGASNGSAISAALIAGAVRWGPGTMPSFPEPVPRALGDGTAIGVGPESHAGVFACAMKPKTAMPERRRSHREFQGRYDIFRIASPLACSPDAGADNRPTPTP